MNLSSFPRWKLLVFGLLSGADFGLTYFLIGGTRAGLYESNPLAGWWLGHFGWAGLAMFKVLTVALVAALAFAIWLRRPRAVHRILTFGCGAAGAVVLYSCYLAGVANGPVDAFIPGERAAYTAAEQRLADQQRLNAEYQLVLRALGNDLAEGRCGLVEAADRLALTQLAADEVWLRGLRAYYPGLGDRAALAASAAKFTLRARDCHGDDPLARRLSAQLYDLCGVNVSMELPPTRASDPASVSELPHLPKRAL